MRKFLIGLVTGFILTVLTVVIVLFAMARYGNRRPVIADGSVLMLKLEDEIPELPSVEYPIPFLERRTALTVRDVWELLRKAAVDSRIKAVVLQPSSLDIGWGKMQELRADLEQFKKSGKPLFAYLKSPHTKEYYLGTAADRVFMPPEDLLDLKGLRVEIAYFRKTLDKLGVEFEVEHEGKYKDAGDMFTRTSMTPETRQVLDSVLDELYGNLLETVATGRKKSSEEIRATLDDGPFMSHQALAKGLVDAVVFEDQMLDEIKTRLGGREVKRVGPRDYMKIAPGSLGLEGKQRIALLVGEGAITRGDQSDDPFSTQSGLRSEAFTKLLRRVGNDSGIKGVIVRIDSPGGEVTASDEIWREMNLLSKKKPMVISMSDLAASGGYYMSMTGDPILAYPGTLTGSIGVLFGKATLRGLYDKLGVTKDTLTRGRFADIDSDYTPMTPAGRAKLREGIDHVYKDFVQKVAESRKRPYEEIEPMAQGRVWLGSQAKPRGLVDELGGLDRAIELVKQKAKIAPEEKVTVVTYPPKRSIFEVIFSRGSEASLESRLLSFLKIQQAKLWMEGGMLRMMPFQIEVH